MSPEIRDRYYKMLLGGLLLGGSVRGVQGLRDLYRHRDEDHRDRQLPQLPRVPSVPGRPPSPLPAKTATDRPYWYRTGLAASGLAGLGLGYTAANGLLGAADRQDEAEQLADAQQQFRDAIASLTAARKRHRGPKTAADRPRDAVSRLYDRLYPPPAAKQASLLAALGATTGEALSPGNWLAAGTGIAGAGAYLGYTAQREKSRHRALKRLYDRRRAARLLATPPELDTARDDS